MSKGENRSWLSPFLRPLRPILAEVLAMSFFVNLLALALPVFSLQVYDRVIGHQGFSTLQGLVIGMLLVLFFDFALRQARSRIMQTVALRIDVVVGRELFRKFMSLPLHVLESRTSNQWQALFRDVDAVRNTLSGSSAVLICDIPFAILFLGVILAIAAPVAWVLVIVLPIFMFVAWRSAGVMASANKAERNSSMTRDGLIAEMIAGRSTIKALALDRSMGPLWEATHAENIENAIVRGSRTDLYQNVGASLTMLTTVAMSSVGAIAIITQSMTMGALVASNMLSSRLLGPLNQLVAQWRSFSSFKQSVERLGEIFAMEGERQESELKLGRPKGEIIAEQVVFSYAKDLAPVVDNVSVTIKSGGIHALVGRNGSGKTTLLKLLMGLYRPTTGRVLLDGADIVQFTRAELATWMGYVPQDCVLFAGTVRDNIAYRLPGATDEQIVKAATAAGVHHFIIDLPDGYATEIGEAGRRLSGGQRQRIAIARALVGDPAVVMLDEPSSSLDRQAEQELRNTLVEIGKEHTVVIVTHSPILLAACDDLVALDRGKIALAGPSKEILPRLFGQAPSKGEAAPPQAAAAQPASAPPAAPRPAPQPMPPRAAVPPPGPMAAPSVAPPRPIPPPGGPGGHPTLPPPRPPAGPVQAAPPRPAPPPQPATAGHPTLPPPRPPSGGAAPAPMRPAPSHPAAAPQPPQAAARPSAPVPPQSPQPAGASTAPNRPAAAAPPTENAAQGGSPRPRMPLPPVQPPQGPQPAAAASGPQEAHRPRMPLPPVQPPQGSPAPGVGGGPHEPPRQRMPLPPVQPPQGTRSAAAAGGPPESQRPRMPLPPVQPSAALRAPAPPIPAAPEPRAAAGEDPYSELARKAPPAQSPGPSVPPEPSRAPASTPDAAPKFGQAPRLPPGKAEKTAPAGDGLSAAGAPRRPRLPTPAERPRAPSPAGPQASPGPQPRRAAPENGGARPQTPHPAVQDMPAETPPALFRAASADMRRPPAAAPIVTASGLFGRHAGTELFADDLDDTVAVPTPMAPPSRRPQAERKP